ncbi:acyl--CoA ligase [Kaustia mangrovi]|uniref:Acyl--CoA ligase n=1 Tax=Kaustia mangrovi TaxID=2593653 RepID=A0A7S8C3U8_9HYPH|nr:class I adenylate-forming enzyme family protein [Kaustia mangrovi]QPC42857.1 acyl--CoA ligase [Kaustia mangrovi]
MSTACLPPEAWIHILVDRLGDMRADDEVLADDGHALTGRMLAAAVEEAAGHLAGLGVRGGDRVLVVNENCVALAVAIFALSRLGAWVVPLNARLTGEELSAISAHATPRLALYMTGVSPAAREHAERAGAEPVDLGPIGEVMAGPVADSVPEPVETDGRDQVAALIYTSGTTGTPKGVMLTHANLLFVARMSGHLRRLSPKDRVYGVLPVSHVFGLASMFLGSLCYGTRLRLVARFDAKAAARALEEDRVSVFQGVPAMYARLLELATVRGAPLAAPDLRYISAGGAPLDMTLKRRVEEMWGLALHNGYGLTETAPTVSTTDIDRPAADDTVGPPMPGLGIRIEDPATGREAGPGAIGELCVKGPLVMKGYYRDPDGTARVLEPDGWFHTGDLARRDAEGNLYIVGRLKELIIRSGFNVYPVEVEAALNTHPDVALCAVVGRPVDGNEEVVACVQPVAGSALDEAALRAHVEARLAPYKRPSRYLIMAELPATPTGKLLKATLARMVRDEMR